eukprot:2829116-Pleurochrysis_carterae.AAC.3
MFLRATYLGSLVRFDLSFPDKLGQRRLLRPPSTQLAYLETPGWRKDPCKDQLDHNQVPNPECDPKRNQGGPRWRRRPSRCRCMGERDDLGLMICQCVACSTRPRSESGMSRLWRPQATIPQAHQRRTRYCAGLFVRSVQAQSSSLRVCSERDVASAVSDESAERSVRCSLGLCIRIRTG